MELFANGWRRPRQSLPQPRPRVVGRKVLVGNCEGQQSKRVSFEILLSYLYFFLPFGFFRLEKFRESFKNNIQGWKKFYDVSNPHEIQCPTPLQDIKGLQRLVALRCVRPDKVVPAVQVGIDDSVWYIL